MVRALEIQIVDYIKLYEHFEHYFILREEDEVFFFFLVFHLSFFTARKLTLFVVLATRSFCYLFIMRKEFKKVFLIKTRTKVENE